MISVVILTKNEEKNIEDCLQNLQWCDEIIVIDDYSEDQTLEIIQNSKFKIQNYSSKIKTYQRYLDGDFSAQRNFGLEKATGDWILFVDADERVSEALASEISNIKYQISNINGFYIRRRDFMWGKELEYGETANIKLLRLARKEKGEWQGKVHEIWNVKGKVGELKNSLLHYPHPTISDFLKEINFYSDIRAKELYDRGVKSNFFSIVLYAKMKFIINYFLKLGIFDGIEGLITALMMSFHSFLARSKLWLLWQKK
ncbi:MAG: glycosyltransferase family 2 protein [Candidatus Levybacteria bacterium]|nr:glycosyltransferase family 2 protein [Candidatus Levybacteria bacterium]